MAKQASSFKVNMLLERETKGALRYMEVDDESRAVDIGSGAKIGTLYIRKDAFASGIMPKSLQLSVDW